MERAIHFGNSAFQAMAYRRKLVVDFLLWKFGFLSRIIHVSFVMEKVALGYVHYPSPLVLIYVQ
jgi:hypothetical protein